MVSDMIAWPSAEDFKRTCGDQVSLIKEALAKHFAEHGLAVIDDDSSESD